MSDAAIFMLKRDVKLQPVALVLSRLDYGNATLAGLSANLLNYLQSVLNASVRPIAGLHRSTHVTNTLASFRWLGACERMKL